MKRRVTKRVLGILLLTTMLLSGCSGNNNKNNDNPSSQSGGMSSLDESKQSQSNTNTKALKIAIVTSPTGVDDGSFNQEIYSGLQAFIKDNPDATVTPIQESSGDPQAAVSAVADVVADYDVFVCCGYQFEGIGVLAQDNPDTKFILVDGTPMGADGNEAVCENVYGMKFAEQESGFFAGMAAALETQTGKVAVVNGIAFPSNVNYQYGFESGVNYVNKQYQKNVELVSLPSYAGTDSNGKNVGGNYIGSFGDEAKGKVVGQALIDAGCDILFVAAGGSGNGVFTAAKEATGIKVIGCDVDQYDDGINGNSNIVLTSALKVMGKNVNEQLVNIRDGSFQGANVICKADTDSTGFVKTEGRNQLSNDTIEKLDAAYDLVKAGEVIPPSSIDEQSPSNFKGL